MKPKVLIIVRGGVVQEIDASEDMDIYLVDHDNLNCDDPNEAAIALLAAWAPEKPHCICNIEDAVATELKEYEKGDS